MLRSTWTEVDRRLDGIISYQNTDNLQTYSKIFSTQNHLYQQFQRKRVVTLIEIQVLNCEYLHMRFGSSAEILALFEVGIHTYMDGQFAPDRSCFTPDNGESSFSRIKVDQTRPRVQESVLNVTSLLGVHRLLCFTRVDRLFSRNFVAVKSSANPSTGPLLLLI